AAEQPRWADRRPPALPTAYRPDPRRVETAAIVEHLQHNAVLADFGQHLVPDPRARVPQHIRARFSHGQQQIGDTFLVQAKPPEGVTQNMTHNRDAERLTREHQAELNWPNVPDLGVPDISDITA